MHIYNRFILILGILLSVFIKAAGALTMAFVPDDLEERFLTSPYNVAKIRQACIDVHGKEWFKRAVLERKFCAASIELSNAGFMQFSFKMVDPKDLQDFKDVVDYMAARNDTLYFGFAFSIPYNFKEISASPEGINKHLHEQIPIDEKIVLNPVGYFLRVGSLPDMTDPDLIIMHYPFNALWGGPLTADFSMEYWEKCKKEGYVDISSRRFDKTKVTDRDIDLYYDYIVAENKHLLASRPKRTIPIDVRYDATPNEQGFYIKWKYVSFD